MGLTAAEACRRLVEAGPNAVPEAQAPGWRMFLAKFWGPIPWMLEGAIFLQLGLGQHVEAVMIGGLLVFNAVLGTAQETRATAALAALRERLAATALVRRDGEWARRPASELAPGDVIGVALGALVPADARIVSGAVMLDQSMVTGESVPVDVTPGDIAYAGSLVRRGQAIAEVIATGSRTYSGRAAELVHVARGASTEQAAILAATRALALLNGTVATLTVLYAHAMGLPAADLVRLALTALLASIPVALPATFTLSAAIGARTLARRGVLLTRLSAAHEAATMDTLCSDKTGTLTRATLTIDEVAAMPGVERERVLALAALASAEADHDPVDAAILRAARRPGGVTEPRVRFVPFDPATRMSEAVVLDHHGVEVRIVKGAFAAVAEVADVPGEARRLLDDLTASGHRVIAVALGPSAAPLRLAGLIAFSDPPRDDSAPLVSALRALGVRTLMVTGDSPGTAAAVARKVGIPDTVCPTGSLPDTIGGGEFGVYARVTPEEKYRLVGALQRAGRVVGMCGDGANDAPALRQAQIGIAVSSATDVAKAAAGMVLTEPGLAGIVFAVREGRIAFQRLLTYTFNMLVKKVEIVLFLAVGLALTGHEVMTPVLMVLMLVTNDFLSMSLTTDRASPSSSPGRWRMRRVAGAAVILGACKLAFSSAVLVLGAGRLGLGTGQVQTLAFVTLVLGNQAVLYVLRERRRLWRSRPSRWVLLASVVDVGVASALAVKGILMEPLPWWLVVGNLGAAAGFALILDQAKISVLSRLRIE
jgi:H+-transporting ATPase